MVYSIQPSVLSLCVKVSVELDVFVCATKISAAIFYFFVQLIFQLQPFVSVCMCDFCYVSNLLLSFFLIF